MLFPCSRHKCRDPQNKNLSNAGIPTVKKITDLYAIKKTGFYCYDAGASNAPMSSRGGMVIANYLSDAWISLNVVPYALSKIYTNSKYNSTWTGWSELASKNDLPQFGLTPGIDCASNTVTEFKVTFPKAFSKAPVVIATPISNTTGINGIPKYAVWNVTTTGFTIRIYNDDSGQRSPAFCWMAMAQS